jgi:hypothetical protein
MSKKFFDLPIEQKVILTKESIEKELEIHEGGYPKHVSMNANYMLEIFEHIEKLSKFKKDAEKLFQRQKLGFEKSAEDKTYISNELQIIIDLANERCIDSQVIAELLKLTDKING